MESRQLECICNFELQQRIYSVHRGTASVLKWHKLVITVNTFVPNMFRNLFQFCLFRCSACTCSTCSRCSTACHSRRRNARTRAGRIVIADEVAQRGGLAARLGREQHAIVLRSSAKHDRSTASSRRVEYGPRWRPRCGARHRRSRSRPAPEASCYSRSPSDIDLEPNDDIKRGPLHSNSPL